MPGQGQGAAQCPCRQFDHAGVQQFGEQAGVHDFAWAASPHFEPFVAPYLEPRCSSIVEAVVTAAGGLGVSPLEVALAWIRDRPGPILGARTVGQLLGALAVEEMELPAEIVQALDDVSAIPLGYPEREG